MKTELSGFGVYEAPVVVEMDIVSRGLLCTSTFTELENYNFLDEQAW